ncbi:MAG: hypothetical protein Q8L98_03250 [Chlamydiales bacterium]|nr:hypothetical protein [Chlamydiales bacterium]
MQEDFKDILNKLLLKSSIASSLKSQITISSDRATKKVSLSLPIFAPFGPMPAIISEYVSKRQGHRFTPHSTYFTENDGKIFLIQEIPFQQEDSLRRQAATFWTMAERCHTMLKEIALEEKSKYMEPEYFS